MNSTRILTSLGILLVPILSFSQKVFELDISGQWKFTIGDREEYAAIDYDDENWEYLEVPSPWEAEGFSNYNGYAWYRFTFDGSDLKHTKNLLLNLGYIDDVHEAYLNNELLGFKGSFPPRYYTAYDALNEYHIPSNLINENGKNVIAVRVYDLTLDGGIVKGNDIGIWYQTQTEDFQNLAGVWEFTKKEPYNWSEP